MTITGLALKRSKRSEYCFISQGFENSEIEVFKTIIKRIFVGRFVKSKKNLYILQISHNYKY